MKQKVVVALLLCAIFSCNKKPQPLTSREIKEKADSLVNIRIRQADVQSNTDLEYRMKIEVKVKVDSILQARMQAARKDSAPRLPKPQMPAMAIPKNAIHR